MPAMRNSIMCIISQTGTPYDNLAELSERVVAAAEQSGIGLTLLPVLYQYGGCDQRPLGAGQIRFGNDYERFARLHEGASKAVARLGASRSEGDSLMGVAPHSLRAVSPEALSACVSLAGARPLHMHLAEQVKEVEEVEAAYGKRPVDWLLDHHDVKPNWCLIHCTQMTDRETDALAATGAVAGLLSDHRIQPWRRHLQWGALSGKGRKAGAGVGF